MSTVTLFACLLATAVAPRVSAREAVPEPSPVAALALAKAAADPLEAEAKEGEALFDDASLAPYFTDKALADAAEHVRAGRGAAALKLLPAKPKDPPGRFLRALALSLAGDAAGAAAAFEQVATEWPAMAARARCHAADAYVARNDLGAAARMLESCGADPVRGRWARLERAKLLGQLGQRDEALAEAKALASVPGLRAEALFVEAGLRAAKGEKKEALELYRTLFVEEPASARADDAKKAARELVTKLKAAPIADERLALRAERLMELGRVREATALLHELPDATVCEGTACTVTRCREPGALPSVPSARGAAAAKAFAISAAQDDEPGADDALATPACLVADLAKPADALSCRLQFVRGWVARKTRANQKALDLLRPVYERCADASIRARALHLAQGAANAVRDADTVELAVVLSLQFPAHPLADDALVSAAAFARDQGDRALERRLLRRVVRAHVESDQRAEALFRLFWSHRAEGRPDRGLAALETLSREYDAGPRSDGGDAERGRYWWGRTVAQAAATPADRRQGLDRLVSLARERPLTYYGLLARSWLGAQEPAIAAAPLAVAPHAGRLRTGLLAGDPAFTQAIEYWRMGFVKEAREQLLGVNFKALRADGRRGREGTILVAELVSRLGDERAAHALVRRELLKHLREGGDALARRGSLVAFPLAFRDHVSTFATQAGFAPNFLQGLMREESALDPRAKSPVGARGLTQVMPATARQVARSIGLRSFRVDHLWVPETNLRIGSTYLGRMLKQFGHPGLAAAAYNAGPGAVQRWLDAAGGSGPFDEFVEDIPFSETRGYVKRVLRSYAAYDYLYETSAADAMRVSLALRGTLPPQP